MTPEQLERLNDKIEIMFLRSFLKQSLPWLKALGRLDEPTKIFTSSLHKLIEKIEKILVR